MTSLDEVGPGLTSPAANKALSDQWRVLTRAATAVALLTSPVVFVWLHREQGWSTGWSLLGTVVAVAAVRGLVDIAFRRFIPWPSLFGVEDVRDREEDVVNRRRAWFWLRIFRLAVWLAVLNTVLWVILRLTGDDTSWLGAIGVVWDQVSSAGPLLFLLPFYLLFNFAILFGPLMLMGITQIRGFEPGDADWGVKLEDVRGQAEAKEEVRKIVNLWQSGEHFVKAGGKRERGILFVGAPGTGKTMLAKAIATGFNSPIVTIPGSGFAQTFIGMDAVIVRWLARKAKKMARKWGGQCIVFIDEIDAVGMRRAALGGAYTSQPTSIHDVCFFGPNGALTASGDVVLQSEEWRDRVFALREPPRVASPGFAARLGGIVNQAMPGMFGGGGQLALNQLLVVMDGIDNPPFLRRVTTNFVNSLLDATYVIPRRIGQASLRLPRARPSGAQIYFIGATNVPLEALDPALTRPGRLGRHVWFRTPTKPDRMDIFDLYLGKVDHDPDLDMPKARDELARVTNGYSPAMIEQVCSMALTRAHHEARQRFSREDILEALTTVESGTAIGWEYKPDEAKATAIHEAGHAVAAHAYAKEVESTRLSIKRRGYSGGHHQAAAKEDRFAQWRSDVYAELVWILGAMAAEYVFYGQNTTGVGGDVGSVSALASAMVGGWAMGPERVQLNGGFPTSEEREAAEERIMRRYEQIGSQILRRMGTGPADHDPAIGVLGDREKRALVAQLLGQAFLAAYHLVQHNRTGVERIADTLLIKQEIYGDDLVALLDSVNLQIPRVDLTKEEAWPTL
jgi:ATP-dependent Zn protease